MTQISQIKEKTNLFSCNLLNLRIFLFDKVNGFF